MTTAIFHATAAGPARLATIEKPDKRLSQVWQLDTIITRDGQSSLWGTEYFATESIARRKVRNCELFTMIVSPCMRPSLSFQTVRYGTHTLRRSVSNLETRDGAVYGYCQINGNRHAVKFGGGKWGDSWETLEQPARNVCWSCGQALARS